MYNDDNSYQQNSNSYTGNSYNGNPYAPRTDVNPYAPQTDSNPYESNTGYNPYAGQGFSTYGQPYTTNANQSQQNTQNAYTDAGKYNKPKKEKKQGLTFKKVIVGIASALVLGSVAGAACFGVNYAGNKVFVGEQQTVAPTIEESNQTEQNTQATQTSTVVTNVNLNTTVMDVSEIVNAVIPSVVAINGTVTYTSGYGGFFGNQTYQAESSGSGIIIGSNDTELLVVTNNHVIEDMDDGSITVQFYDGSTATANVKGTKASSDLAVIAIPLASIPEDAIYSIATLGDSSEVKVGEAAIAIGNSMGYGISVTTGIISALNRSVTVSSSVYDNLIQTDAAINPGNSGGPLFNAKGEVIGINSVKMSSSDVEGMGYAISISSVQDIIKQLSEEETKIKLTDDERGYLGVSGVTITSDISASYGYPVGALIRSVASNSAAASAGLVKNDIIVSFDGHEIESYDALYQMMYYYPIGAKVVVEFYRMNNNGDFELMSAEVTLTARPD